MKYRNGTPQPGFYCLRGHRYKKSSKTLVTGGVALERKCSDCSKTQHTVAAKSFLDEFPPETEIFADGLVWTEGPYVASSETDFRLPWSYYYP
jgi:hypothetical protein